MANKKATMTDLRLLIREFIKGTSKRKISEILNLSRTSIDVYLGRMDASGKSAEELLHSDDKTLSQVMVRDSGHRNTDSEKLDELTPLLEDYARQMQLRRPIPIPSITFMSLPERCRRTMLETNCGLWIHTRE